MKTRVCLTSLLLLCGTPALADDEVEEVIDLRVQGEEPIFVVAPPDGKMVKIKAKYRSAGTAYNVTVSFQDYFVKAPEMPNPADPNGLVGLADDCKTLATAYSSLQSEKSEVELPRKIGALREAKAAVTEINKCGALGISTADIDSLIAEVESWSVRNFLVRPGDTASIVITREGAGGKPSMWKRTIVARPPGEFDTVFSLLMLTNPNTTYVTKTSKDASNADVFTVTRQNDSEFTAVPAVMFRWVPAAQKNDSWNLGFSGGVGLDPTALTGFLGGEVLFSQRTFALQFGAYIRQAKRLARQYREGEVVTGPLTEDQLSEEYWGHGLYLGFGYKFGSNPFSGTTK